MVNVLFQVLSLFLELASQVTIVLILLLELLLNVDLVQTDNLLLQLFEIADLVQTLVHVVFKLLDFVRLLFEHCGKLPLFKSEALLAHTKVFHDEA